MIKIFSIGDFFRRTFAATATLLKKQKPMDLFGSAWWPGGRTIATARLHFPVATAIAASMVAPQLSRTDDGVLWLTNNELAV